MAQDPITFFNAGMGKGAGILQGWQWAYVWESTSVDATKPANSGNCLWIYLGYNVVPEKIPVGVQSWNTLGSQNKCSWTTLKGLGLVPPFPSEAPFVVTSASQPSLYQLVIVGNPFCELHLDCSTVDPHALLVRRENQLGGHGPNETVVTPAEAASQLLTASGWR